MTLPAQVDLLSAGELQLLWTPEWESVCAWQHNILIEGTDPSTERVLGLLEPHLRTPVFWEWSPSLSEVRLDTGCALVLRNVAALTADDQAGLLRWLDDSGHQAQVVSMTARPLFPLVARGLFDEALYYRLNVILLCVGASSERDVNALGSPAVQSPHPQRMNVANGEPLHAPRLPWV